MASRQRQTELPLTTGTIGDIATGIAGIIALRANASHQHLMTNEKGEPGGSPFLICRVVSEDAFIFT